MSKLVIPNARASVRKGFEVIMARGQNDLELSDLKLFNYLLDRAYFQLDKVSIHQIPVKDALGYLGHSSVARLEDSLRRLGKVQIEIDYTQDEVEHSVSCHFLSYDVSRTENGILEYAPDKMMLRFLWEPKVYARINMRIFQLFRTSYGAKLYEIMALFQNRRIRTWTVTVEELREKLGVSPSQYERFDNLKKAVIDRAVNDVNEIATFGVAVEMKKSGRGGRVTHLSFSIVPRADVIDTAGDGYPAASRKGQRDPKTPDLLDGQTDEERGSDMVVTSETIDRAHEILTQAGMPAESIQTYLDDWRGAVKMRRISDPDHHFLQYLNLKIEAAREDELGDLDPSLITDLLKDFD
jgi:hypothetical protein